MKTIAIANQKGARTCTKCYRSLPLTEFYLDKKRPSGYYPTCKTCEQARRSRSWRSSATRPMASSKVCGRCQIEKSAREFKRFHTNKDGLFTYCKTCAGMIEAQRRKDIKSRLIEGYGARCACCGETTLEFLTLDHVHGGGRADSRRLSGNMHVLWSQIIKQGFPDSYRLLCWNCNSSRGAYGCCPHQKVAEAA